MSDLSDSAFSEKLDSFRRNLAETVAWCTFRLNATNPSGNLRSRSLQPDSFDPARAWLRYSWGTQAHRSQIVDALAAKRAGLLQSHGQHKSVRTASLNLTPGRLLLYYPDANLYDGAAEVLSDGFFDADNAPPWDTWVLYINDPPREGLQGKDADSEGPYQQEAFSSYLMSWVPSECITLATAGLWANPEQCLVWADEANRPFMHLVPLTS